jgi:hypothetical protein
MPPSFSQDGTCLVRKNHQVQAGFANVYTDEHLVWHDCSFGRDLQRGSSLRIELEVLAATQPRQRRKRSKPERYCFGIKKSVRCWFSGKKIAV